MYFAVQRNLVVPTAGENVIAICVYAKEQDCWYIIRASLWILKMIVRCCMVPEARYCTTCQLCCNMQSNTPLQAKWTM